jgi:phage shock protein A
LEALRQRKKLEQDVLELEAALEATARARGEVEKNYKRFQQQIRDLELVVEEEQAAAQVNLSKFFVTTVFTLLKFFPLSSENVNG